VAKFDWFRFISLRPLAIVLKATGIFRDVAVAAGKADDFINDLEAFVRCFGVTIVPGEPANTLLAAIGVHAVGPYPIYVTSFNLENLLEICNSNDCTPPDGAVTSGEDDLTSIAGLIGTPLAGSFTYTFTIVSASVDVGIEIEDELEDTLDVELDEELEGTLNVDIVVVEGINDVEPIVLVDELEGTLNVDIVVVEGINDVEPIVLVDELDKLCPPRCLL